LVLSKTCVERKLHRVSHENLPSDKPPRLCVAITAIARTHTRVVAGAGLFTRILGLTAINPSAALSPLAADAHPSSGS